MNQQADIRKGAHYYFYFSGMFSGKWRSFCHLADHLFLCLLSSLWQSEKKSLFCINLSRWLCLLLSLSRSEWSDGFLSITSWDPSVCMSNRLHVDDILRFTSIKSGYILLEVRIFYEMKGLFHSRGSLLTPPRWAYISLISHCDWPKLVLF